MASSKTVIKGLDEPMEPNQGNQQQNFYSRGNASPARGTIVPGMMGMSDVQAEVGARGTQGVEHPKSMSGKPVVGFLYSVSRTGAGEYWPLHIGQNTIGKSSSCDIALAEGTVSSEHAVLVVRKLKKPEKVIASINDARSTNGTMLNGESLGFSAVECHNGDVITIGDNYELYLVLIDVAELGLRQNPEFIAVEEEAEADNEWNEEFVEQGYTRPGGNPGFPPPFSGPDQSSFGTVGLDGSTSGNMKGGTVTL